MFFRRRLADARSKNTPFGEHDERFAIVQPGSGAVRAQAAGAMALGALALGSVAIGALAIGRLAVGRAGIRHLEIDELIVRKLQVEDTPHVQK